jgi:DNA polymerase III epsilon subunit family exonuclease
VKDIDDIEFTVFDTETTGLNPELGDRIVEIAAVRLNHGREIAQFHSLVNPQRPISEAAFRVNRISPDMVAQAPRMEAILPGFMKFIGDSCLCSYNAGFDMAFLHNEIALTGAAFPLQDLVVVDILKMARKLLPSLERHALWFVAEKLGMEERQEHRARSDVALTIAVFDFLTAELRKKGIRGFENMVRLFGLDSDYLRDIHAQRIAELEEAISLGARVRIKYLCGSSARVSERHVVPREVKNDGKHAYLIGHCELRNEERTFRVDNIVDLELENTQGGRV